MLSFSDILAPVGPARFFAERHRRDWLHVPAAGHPAGAAKFAAVMSRAKLDGLVASIGLWDARSLQLARDSAMLPTTSYCDAAGRPDAGKLRALLDDGASLVLNDIDLNAPALDGVFAVAQALETALEAKVQANLYASPRERQAFASHYDTHDVFAVHVEGEKLWRIYEGCSPDPIEHPFFKSESRAHHERAKGKVAAEVLMRPGDLLYIPRGRYHDAVARSARTIHIAFGAVSVIGMDAISALFEAAVREPLFRADLPRRRGAGPETGEAAFAARLAALGRRLSELAATPDLLAAMRDFQDGYRYRAADAPPRYRVTAEDFRVVPQGDAWVLMRGGKGAPIPPGLDRAVAWVVARRDFAENDLAQALPALDAETRGELLRALAAMKIIAL